MTLFISLCTSSSRLIHSQAKNKYKHLHPFKGHTIYEIVSTMITIVLTACFFIQSVTLSFSLTGEWDSCKSILGVCIDTDSYTCSLSTKTGLCPGPSQVRCCPSPGGVKSSQCTARKGVCKRSSHCLGTTLSNLCPGPYTVKCCPSSSDSSSSSGSSSSGTEYMHDYCSSNWMSKAGKKLTQDGWKIGFRPTTRARLSGRDKAHWAEMWRDLQKCITFPILTSDQRESIFEQLACHAKWGVTPFQGGRTWDFEAWRPPIGLKKALSDGWWGLDPPDHGCNWN